MIKKTKKITKGMILNAKYFNWEENVLENIIDDDLTELEEIQKLKVTAQKIQREEGEQ